MGYNNIGKDVGELAKKRELERLENQLMAENPRVYNSDRTDVDMEQFSEEVCQTPRKGSCLGIIIVILLAAIAVFLYLALGGGGK